MICLTMSLPGRNPLDFDRHRAVFSLLNFLTRVEVQLVARNNEHSEQGKRLVDLCNAIREKIHALDSEGLIDEKIIDYIGALPMRLQIRHSPDEIEGFLERFARQLEDVEPG